MLVMYTYWGYCVDQCTIIQLRALLQGHLELFHLFVFFFNIYMYLHCRSLFQNCERNSSVVTFQNIILWIMKRFYTGLIPLDNSKGLAFGQEVILSPCSSYIKTLKHVCLLGDYVLTQVIKPRCSHSDSSRPYKFTTEMYIQRRQCNPPSCQSRMGNWDESFPHSLSNEAIQVAS